MVIFVVHNGNDMKWNHDLHQICI